MSAAASVSPLASTSGLPCSCVSSGAMSLARSRISAAALRMITLRAAGTMSRQTSKTFCAACSARSRSGRPASATRPISLPVAGFTTGSVFPSTGGCNWPLMKSCVSTYPMGAPSAELQMLPLDFDRYGVSVGETDPDRLQRGFVALVSLSANVELVAGRGAELATEDLHARVDAVQLALERLDEEVADLLVFHQLLADLLDQLAHLLAVDVARQRQVEFLDHPVARGLHHGADR